MVKCSVQDAVAGAGTSTGSGQVMGGDDDDKDTWLNGQ